MPFIVGERAALCPPRDRDPPHMRGIQYAAAIASSASLEYWIARSSRAMTMAAQIPNAETRRILATRCARGFEKSFRPQRAWGTPGAHGTRSRACSVVVARALVTTSTRDHPTFPHAMVLRFTPRSPWRRIRLVTVVGELTAYPRPVGPTCLRQLDTSNGCQDHTASPSASTSFVSAPFDRSRVWLNPKPALQSLARLTLPRPPHPAPRQ